jgi:hypothetical protein
LVVKRRQGAIAAIAGSDEIVVYASKSKAVGYALLAGTLAGLFVMGSLFVLTGLHGAMHIRVLALWVTVLILLLTAMYVLFLAFSSTPRLVVSSEGVWVHSPFVFGTGNVPWSDIAGILDARIRVAPPVRTPYLVILLRDRQTLRARQNAGQMVLSLLSGYTLIWLQAVVVNATLLSMPSAELLGRMRLRYGPELALHGIEVRGDRA